MNKDSKLLSLDSENAFLKTLLVLLLLFVFVYFFKLGDYGLLDVDEPRYAEAAREMIESNNWITPYFNYVVRYDKPILFYWLDAILMLIFGVNELSARLPSVLMSFLCASFVYIFIRKYFSQVVALLGVLVLMTSFEYAALSRVSIPDMTLTAFITASIVSFYLGYCELVESGRFYKDQITTFSVWYIIAFVFAGLAFLTKGPVVLVLEFVIFCPFFWWIRKLDYFLRNKSFWIGFFLFLILILPWYVAVHHATGGEFTTVFFGLHNFTRFTSVVSGHKGELYFYIPVVMLGFLPWTFFLPQSIYAVVKEGLPSLLKGPKQQASWFCLWWFLAIFIFFSFSKTQLLTYILSSFPALAIIVTLWFDALLHKKDSLIGLVRGLGIFFAFSLVVFYVCLFHLDLLLPVGIKGLNLDIYIMFFAFLIVVGVSMAWASSSKDFFLTVCIVLSTFLIFYFGLINNIIPKIDKHAQSKLRLFSQSMPTNVELATYQITKPSITFYAQRQINKYGKLKKLKKRIMQSDKFAFVAKKVDLHRKKLSGVYKWGEDYRYVFYTNYPLE